MNGRKRKWKGGQGEKKGTDLQIKFSGHLNKHLSRRSRGGGAGDVWSWAAQGALQQDTSNKQHLKPCVLSLPGFSSEIISLPFPQCLQLASISSAALPLSRAGPRHGDPCHGSEVSPRSPMCRRVAVDPWDLIPAGERGEQAKPSCPSTVPCCFLFPPSRTKEQRRESRNC